MTTFVFSRIVLSIANHSQNGDRLSHPEGG